MSTLLDREVAGYSARLHALRFYSKRKWLEEVSDLASLLMFHIERGETKKAGTLLGRIRGRLFNAERSARASRTMGKIPVVSTNGRRRWVKGSR